MTRYLVNEAALDFYDALGGQSAIAAHAEKMLDFAEDLFCKSFGLKPSPIPKNLQAPYLRLIGKKIFLVKVANCNSMNQNRVFTVELTGFFGILKVLIVILENSQFLSCYFDK